MAWKPPIKANRKCKVPPVIPLPVYYADSLQRVRKWAFQVLEFFCCPLPLLWASGRPRWKSVFYGEKWPFFVRCYRTFTIVVTSVFFGTENTILRRILSAEYGSGNCTVKSGLSLVRGSLSWAVGLRWWHFCVCARKSEGQLQLLPTSPFPKHKDVRLLNPLSIGRPVRVREDPKLRRRGRNW